MSRMKCKDCGKNPYEPSSQLESVCGDCWDLRGRFMDALTKGKLGVPELQAVQARMNNQRWQGAKAMQDALAALPPHP